MLHCKVQMSSRQHIRIHCKFWDFRCRFIWFFKVLCLLCDIILTGYCHYGKLVWKFTWIGFVDTMNVLWYYSVNHERFSIDQLTVKFILGYFIAILTPHPVSNLFSLRVPSESPYQVKHQGKVDRVGVRGGEVWFYATPNPLLWIECSGLYLYNTSFLIPALSLW